MSQSTIPVVAPSYLSPRCLPYASDIFYHDRIIYFGPTGIHPLEWHAVAGFPEYCRKQQIALPQLIWEMTNAYFENSRLAVKAADVLRPLQPQHVLIVVAVYDRDEVAIQKAKKMLLQHRDLIDLFERTSFELPFPSRELLSHLFLDLFMQRGYEGVIEYLREETHSPDRFIQLLVAVLLNRFRLFAGRESSLLLYEHSWYPFLLRACSIQQASVASTSQDTTDPQEVEHLCYKLFETILLPLFGRVDSPDKAEEVAKISSDRNAEIAGMKTECRRIARDIVTSGTEDSSLKEEILRDAIQERISEPLAALLGKPRNGVLRLLRDFVLDSTVIGGLLSITQGAGITTAGVAAAAGALSAGFRYLISERSQRKIQPSLLLIEGIRRVSLEAEAMHRHLQSISMRDLAIPVEWQHLAQPNVPKSRSEKAT